MDATQENGGKAGLARRRQHIVGSRVVDMMGRLHVDLFMQDPFLLNGVTVRVRLVRSKDSFSLMAGGANPDYKVCIVDAVLFVRKAILSPTVQIAHIQALTKAPVTPGLRPGYDLPATEKWANRRKNYDWWQRSYDWWQRWWVIARGKSVATRS